jgi:hypothetical protein
MRKSFTYGCWHEAEQHDDSEHPAKEKHFRSLMTSNQVPASMHEGRAENQGHCEGIHFTITL